MDTIKNILSIASKIHTLVHNVKANKKRCHRVAQRVEALAELVRSIKEGKEMVLEKALKELSFTLESAQELIKKYTLANWMERILKSRSHGDEFNSVNERLNDTFQDLSGALKVEQRNMVRQIFDMAQDKVDGRTDDAELKKLILDHMKEQKEKTDAMLINVIKFMEMLNKPSPSDEDIRLIKPEELEYGHPKVKIAETSNSEIYKGQYRGFTVAIKRYSNPVNTSPGVVEDVFKKEVETMKRFESPNILRMFGICKQAEDGPSPQYLIITEYCEKGSLRQVLDSKCELSWTRKARLCLDAAQGLYRLHQTEEKSKVHGCIKSSRFLVAEGYRVKLAGFELAKTESSLRKMTKGRDKRSLCYSSPEMLSNLNHTYSKECEIYSFGIVLWEIVTRQRPFEGCSNEEISQKVCNEKYQEPLPDDCPEPLGCLINACRTYDSFQRPSAGVLVDKLRSVVAQMEEE
ncbi:mixed lineage kinase domain-like protein [Thunnus albacares]|uniref:mixed lineage kinase domain-like protein n=1 Tax=Thunnus albacares TaxID=8236 RepID=UPI001CF64517|nr:mixed lineage kinase domain-like protein [Thunnus albacares]